jgi:DNA-binding Lrp family transcriptional regulator
MRYNRRIERFTAYYDPRVVGYDLPRQAAIGIADYAHADKIRKAELDRKWKRAFKKAFGVNPEPPAKKAPRREPDR